MVRFLNRRAASAARAGGGGIGCGIDPLPGTVISRTGEPAFFDVSDISRFLMIDTFVKLDGPLDLQLTANLPDGLEIVVISDPTREGLAVPRPRYLPRFRSLRAAADCSAS
jgi:hypothetical protein